MCGIVYVKGKNANKAILKRYEKQKSRGQSGFGFLGLDKNEIKNYCRTQDENAITALLKVNQYDEVLFHHRYPTSTPNIPECNHPIKVKNKLLDYVYYVVHNGHITNCDLLKEKHEKMGFKYSTELTTTFKIGNTSYEGAKRFNDSEALAIELALFLEGKTIKIETTGDVAFIAIQTKNKHAQKLYFGKNDGNPLTIENQKDFLAITSEGGTALEADTLYCYDYITKKITQQSVEIGTTSSLWNYDDSNHRTSSLPFIDDDDEYAPESLDEYQNLKTEREYIKDEIKNARKLENYDLEADLEWDLSQLDTQLTEFEKRNPALVLNANNRI